MFMKIVNPIVIGFLGRAGSGKDLSASYLKSLYPDKVEILAFANKVKQFAKEMYGFSDEQLYGPTSVKEAIDPRWGISPRFALQMIGQAVRMSNKSYWIEECLENSYLDDKIYCITDVRYPNEASYVKSSWGFSGYVIKLICPNSTSDPKYANHPSEASIDEVPESVIFKTIISERTEGSVDLKRKVLEVFKEIMDHYASTTVKQYEQNLLSLY